MKAKDPRISNLIKTLKDTTAPHRVREEASKALKAIRADLERQAERKLLVGYLERTRATGDADKIAFAAARLDEFDAKSAPVAPETEMPAPETKPAGKSDWQRNHEYWSGESPVNFTPPDPRMDFASSDPMSKSISDLKEDQKRRDPLWDRQAKWQEEQARSQAGNRVQPIKIIRDDSDWPSTF